MKPIALISADWHARRADRVWYRRDAIVGDTGYSISQICDIADQYDVPYVWLLGDLFEQKLQQSDALEVMRKALDRFQARNRQVLFVQGQHERSSPPLLNAIHGYPIHVHKKIVHVAGMCVYGLDYCNPLEVAAELENVPQGVDVLLTHQVWKDFLGEERGDAWFSQASHVRVIATGDYHQTLYEKRGAHTILSPGSICMQKINEPPEKFVFILHDDYTVKQIKLKTRGYYAARLHTEAELNQFVENWSRHPSRAPQPDVPTYLSTNLLRVHYRADLPEARHRLESTVGAEAHLFLEPIPIETQQIGIDAERRVSAVMSGGLEGCINAFYADNPVVHADALRLARTRDVQTELLEIFKERLTNGCSCQ